VKDKKPHISTYHKKEENPFIKIFADKKRIHAAIRKGQSLSSLKDIKFVKPI
jgi:hypothetical protein